MDFFTGQLTGFLVGILSSWVFWYFMLQVKPRVRVSPFVNYLPQQSAFQVKIINRGRRQVVDVHATLTISELRSVGDIAKRKTIRRLPLTNSHISILAPIQDLDKPWTPLTAVTFTTEPDPDAFGLLSAPTQHERRLVLTP